MDNPAREPLDHPSLTYDRPFRTLFEDGVHLLLAAEAVGENDQEHAASIARGSIACTMMLPEVAANICIESLGLEKMIFNDIDRLAPLAKFDYYLRTSFRGRKIPTGVLPIQKLQELKRMRDTFVHPKRFAVEWQPNGDGSYRSHSKTTQFLQMSMNPTMWCSEDAVHAICGAHDFLAFFFSELCGYTKKKVNSLLFSDTVDLGGRDGASVYYYKPSFHMALRRWEVNTSYFRIGVL